ncbi:uncharacterized protein LOC136031431 isoform X2 [Artemia franciscana]|uniref:uncharacterized protein LOC136031431 isoform X2 n=1 Tax=Artemia franciscana TaxID=6661 RepID=UPI0032DA6DC1
MSVTNIHEQNWWKTTCKIGEDMCTSDPVAELVKKALDSGFHEPEYVSTQNHDIGVTNVHEKNLWKTTCKIGEDMCTSDPVAELVKKALDSGFHEPEYVSTQNHDMGVTNVHEKIWWKTTCKIGEDMCTSGFARRKKDSKTIAATEMLFKLRSSPSLFFSSTDPVAELVKKALDSGFHEPEYVSTQNHDMGGNHWWKTTCKIGEDMCTSGCTRREKDSKTIAATEMLDKLKNSPSLFISSTENGRYCHQKHFVRQGQSQCLRTCNKLKDCNIHQCDLRCEFPHYSHKCNEEVVRKLLCGHEINVSCGQTTSTESCNAKVKTTFKCRHEGVGSCSLASTMNYFSRIKIKLRCGHTVTYTCKGGKINCQEPCTKKLNCGHNCPNFCSEPCIAPAQCLVCIELYEENRKSRIEKYRGLARIKLLELKREARKLKVTCLDQSSSKYLDIRDKVLKYIQPVHRWRPEVYSIIEVFNPNLLEDFYSCQADLIEPSTIREKFHGTDSEAINAIILNGFRLPINDTQIRMFGRGIYFATDSSKSAQDVYTEGSNVLLLCDVLLGKEMKVLGPKYNMNLETIKNLGYDSIFAPRDTRNQGGVLFDEFVIYDPRQAYPRYIISYK